MNPKLTKGMVLCVTHKGASASLCTIGIVLSTSENMIVLGHNFFEKKHIPIDTTTIALSAMTHVELIQPIEIDSLNDLH
jgi:hypothetical protein